MAIKERFTALDVFRGMTVCFMIIVNTPGNSDTTFSPLHHAAWHGFTPTDLVFPSFLFAVGNALAFVMQAWQQQTTTAVVGKILKRTLLIFLLGFLMYWFPFVDPAPGGGYDFRPFSDTRILGVLQRISLAYCLAALMLYFFKTRKTVIVTSILLILYWPVCYFFGDASDPYSLTRTAGLKLDLFVLGPAHLYHGEGGMPFDPEGILGTFPSIGNVVAGFLAGKLIRESGKTFETLAKLLLAGAALMTIAYFWHLLFPINKKLWTSSFVLYTVGIDCMILAAIVYVVDFMKITRWTYFFEVFGRNPLFIYLLSEVIAILLWFFTIGDLPAYTSLYQHVFSYAGGYIGSLLFALTVMMVCWLVGWWMDKRKIYVRV